MNTLVVKEECFICKGKVDFLGPSKGYKYFVCSKCKSIQLNPMPTQSELVELYIKKYLMDNENERSMSPEYWKKVSSNYNISILKIIQKHKVKGAILDFGAGYGFLCNMLNSNGYECSGVDLSQDKVAWCNENKIPMINAGIEIFEERKEYFNAITMCAVFEHLSSHVDFLRKMGKGLKKDGLIITLHPTAKIYHLLSYIFRLGRKNFELPSLAGSFTPPWHTAFVSINGMTIIAREAGFIVDGIYPAPQGRLSGILGIIQFILEKVNIVGWNLFGINWPLVTSHIFVLRKLT
jgi:SAM-dependent methyltransferase